MELIDVPSLIAAQERGERLRFLFFWSHESRRDDSGPECLSQWYPSPFELDGALYPTAEHWMMAEKARLFDDEEARRRILAARHPGEAKAIGGTVRGFDEERWIEERVGIVLRGNIERFRSHPRLREFLVGTGGRILAEASPIDRIWGIGLAATDPRVEDPASWQGTNLLGFVLMQVREHLRGEG